jgi:hypothetical protein
MFTLFAPCGGVARAASSSRLMCGQVASWPKLEQTEIPKLMDRREQPDVAAARAHHLMGRIRAVLDDRLPGPDHEHRNRSNACVK